MVTSTTTPANGSLGTRRACNLADTYCSVLYIFEYLYFLFSIDSWLWNSLAIVMAHQTQLLVYLMLSYKNNIVISVSTYIHEAEVHNWS
jgi:hypothetical protein